MSSNKKPIARMTFSYKDEDGTWKNFSIASVWPKDYPGLYRLSLDRGSEKYPAINFIDALKRFASGNGSIEFSVESQREQRGQGGQRQYAAPPAGDGFGDAGGGEFGGDDIPFRRVDARLV